MQDSNRQSRYKPKGTLASIRRQARYLALSLARLGHDDSAIEKQLYSSGFHPSICYETLNWLKSEAIADNGPLEAPSRPLPQWSSWN